jgi:oligoribonuclease NrnB/cAMP/cGMP phosphodiesterase (DHH superfamily)
MSFEIVDSLRNHKIVIVYHAHCADGVGAAWAASCEFPHAEVIPAGYQKELSEKFLQSITNAVVLIVDFSFDADNMRRICEKARYVELLDHHITALQKLVGFEAENFDMSSCRTERSGCGIVWEWMQRNEPMPPLLSHVEDRDLWLFKLPDTKQVMAGFFSYEMKFDVFDHYAYRTEPLKAAGEVALRIEQKHIDSIIKQCKRIVTIGDYKIALVNCNGMFASELGSRLASEYHIVVTYYDDGDCTRKFSLRSKGDINVSNICKHFGGGGHKNAAGFVAVSYRSSIPDLLRFLRESDLETLLKK